MVEPRIGEASPKAKNGVFYGRFQPFHKGHMKAVLMCLERCETLYIGIRIFETPVVFDIGSFKKSERENPFTFGERMLMIKETLISIGIDLKRVNIIPFPLENPDKWYEYVPKDTVHFRIGVSDWDENKIKAFETSGLKIETLPIYEKDIDGEEIRNRIATNKSWKELVTGETAHIIEEVGGVNRVKMLYMGRSSDVPWP